MKNKNRLVFLTTWLKKGGAEQALHILINNMSPHYNIELIVLNKFNTNKKTHINGIKTHFYKTYTIYRAFSIPSPTSLFNILMTLKQADIIFAHQYYTFPAIISSITSKLWRIPFVLKPIAPIPTEYLSKKYTHKLITLIYNKTIGYLVLQNASIITPTSNYERKYLNKLGITNDKIKVIYSGIDNMYINSDVSEDEIRLYKIQLNIPVDEKVLLYAGRIDETKGLTLLINALPSVIDAFPNTRLYFAGDYSDLQAHKYKKKIEKMAGELGIDKKITFLGHLNSEQLIKWYNISDIFLNPSYMETAPLAVREAAAIGVPIVSSKIGGVSEFIKDERDGYLVLLDERIITEAIIKLFNEKREKSPKKQHSWDDYVSNMKTVFARIMMLSSRSRNKGM